MRHSLKPVNDKCVPSLNKKLSLINTHHAHLSLTTQLSLTMHLSLNTHLSFIDPAIVIDYAIVIDCL